MPRPKSAPKKRPAAKKVVKRPSMTASKVAKIAKASVKQIAEKKFFDPLSYVNVSPVVSLAASDNYISCVGFSTTSNDDPYAPTTNVEFPQNTAINQLNMLTPFTSVADPDKKGYIPEGKVVQPVSAKCRWSIQRDFSYLFKGVNSFDQVFTDDLINNLWVDIRMLHVSPKIASGTSGSEIEPRLDLFQDQFGNFVSVDTFDNLSNNELFDFKVNSRRYEVIADKKFVLGNPVTLEWQRHGTGADERYQPRVANVNKECELNITTYHKLSQRKHGKVYYNEVGDIEPTNGHRREYILFLFKYRAADSMIQAIGTSQLQKICPLGLKIKALPESKFIDV
jgi:hypothetical protein